MLIVETIDIVGDMLTNERVQSAQRAIKNAVTAREKLEGYISKIDFHRLTNLEISFEILFKINYK